MTKILGIDGCKKGWFCVESDLKSRHLNAFILTKLDDILTLPSQPAMVAIDIPIGLTDAGPRDCDIAARRFLPGKTSSVFPAPIRAVMDAATYDEARAISKAHQGKSMSKQAWAIVPKIREADEFLRANTTRQGWLREVHPEVSFAQWRDCLPILESKRTPAGQTIRSNLIETRYGSAFKSLLHRLPRAGFAMDDLHDAMAALWTAERIVHGKAFSLPDSPPVDRMSLKMEIVV